MLAYLDCSSGISGDKFLGALIDAGLDPIRVERACATIGLALYLKFPREKRGNVTGTTVTVVSNDTTWRAWASIRTRLEASKLSDSVRERVIGCFLRLAEAEAHVHDIPVDEVHFHEIGAADTIADILGVVFGLELLGVDRLVCSPIALGSGTVQTEHGLLPIPAPATAEILRDVPVYGGAIASELTTPTGAALVASLAEEFGPPPAMTIKSVGRGAGSRQLEIPNVAQLLIGEPLDEQHVVLGAQANDDAAPGACAAPNIPTTVGIQTICILRTAIDHIGAEQLAYACERLLESGALDVWQTPIVMKKGRAGVELTCLCNPAQEHALVELIVRETGSLGVRVERTLRYAAQRTERTVETSLGPIRVKEGPPGEGAHIRPEHDDVARIARETGRPYAAILREIEADIHSATA